jgi:hypothetical protein
MLKSQGEGFSVNWKVFVGDDISIVIFKVQFELLSLQKYRSRVMLPKISILILKVHNAHLYQWIG